MDTKRKAYNLGLLFLILALLSITVLPIITKKIAGLSLNENLFSQIEFFLLFWCACLYAYSSKYYKYQLLSIFVAILIYFMFSNLIF